ncbi:MAG: hypothetical protein ABWZ16_05800 [Microbacterium sp.]
MSELGTPELWRDYAEALVSAGAIAEDVHQGDDPRNRMDLFLLMTSVLASNYLAAVQSDPDYPDIVPVANSALGLGAPCPDFNYFYTAIDDRGVYRLSGRRGTNCFVNFQAGRGWWALKGPEGPGGTLGAFWLDDFSIEDDGAFEILLSASPPADGVRNWWRIPPGTDHLFIRSCANDWISETDPSLAIERLDTPAARPRRSASEIDQALRQVFTSLQRAAPNWPTRARTLIERGAVNRCAPHPAAESGNGVPEQVYYGGLFDIEEDEALVFEAKAPETALYWSLHLNDLAWGHIDAMHRHSSLNGHQASLDGDGVFRAVLSQQDVGVRNWLDCSGYRCGSWLGRWTRASAAPLPKVTRMPVGEVRSYLPPNTAMVTAAERDQIIRERRRGLQLRRRW